MKHWLNNTVDKEPAQQCRHCCTDSSRLAGRNDKVHCFYFCSIALLLQAGSLLHRYIPDTHYKHCLCDTQKNARRLSCNSHHKILHTNLDLDNYFHCKSGRLGREYHYQVHPSRISVF
jgi:hypothetical protein